MTEHAETALSPVAGAADARSGWSAETRELVAFAVATALVWAHTIDEIRIGELIAVPFGAANLAVLAAWPRLRRTVRAGAAIGFGLLWALAVIPYHVLPLLGGAFTGQNVSGLARVLGGALMVGLGIAIWRRRGAGGTPPAL